MALESYRDLVKLLQRGLDDAQGIRAAQQENIELRAQAKSAAAAAAGVPVSNSRPTPSIPSGAIPDSVPIDHQRAKNSLTVGISRVVQPWFSILVLII